MSEKKVLIVYATRFGSARITAKEINDYLLEKGYKTDLIDLKKARSPKDLKTYNLVVAGNSVAMFMWTRQVKGFLKKCKKRGISPAVYINCGMAIDKPEEAKTRFFDKLIDKIGIKPAAVGIFGPALDFTPGTGLSERVKSRIKNTIKPMVKDKYNEQGLMDMRRKEDLATFNRELEDLLT
jgi:menaquinone-dependent protoporphyrinogen IX oxidase